MTAYSHVLGPVLSDAVLHISQTNETATRRAITSIVHLVPTPCHVLIMYRQRAYDHFLGRATECHDVRHH